MEFLYTPTSPFGRKVLVLAHELDIMSRLDLVPAHPRNDVETVSRSNPLGKIPVLITEAGTSLYDSNVICAWLDATLGQNIFHPDGERKWPCLRDIALANGILEAASFVRHELLRPVEVRSQSAMSAEIRRVHRALDELEARPGLFDTPLDMGQLSLACAIDWLPFRLPDENWTCDRPRLTEFIGTLLTRPSLMKTDPRL